MSPSFVMSCTALPSPKKLCRANTCTTTAVLNCSTRSANSTNITPREPSLEILEAYSDSIAYQIGKQVMLVEYGSGSGGSIKLGPFLDALDEPIAYVPVDISEEHLLQTADSVRSAYPEIEILPVVAGLHSAVCPAGKQSSTLARRNLFSRVDNRELHARRGSRIAPIHVHYVGEAGRTVDWN